MSKYKVMDRESGEVILVKSVDKSKHLHCSGVEFGDDVFNKPKKTNAKKTTTKKTTKKEEKK